MLLNIDYLFAYKNLTHETYLLLFMVFIFVVGVG